MKSIKLLLISFLFGFVACNSNEDDNLKANVDDNLQDNEGVVNFLNEVVDIMEANSINRNTLDWIDFRRQVLEKGASAQNIAEANMALRLALILLEDNHSLIRKQNGSIISVSNANCQSVSQEIVTTPDNIGYIAVKISSGSENEQMIAYAKDIQKSIEAEDNENILGWIIDLRGSGGGNMWPALAGIGPILGEGTAGYFIDPNDKKIPWGYSNGASLSNQSPVVQLSNPYKLINPNPKVAVLLDKGIASSGEAIAISFIGRENTMSFGSATCGLSTSNSGFRLSDGSILSLTTAYMADRNENKFGVPIIPDTPSTDYTIILDAIEYLNN